MDGKIRILFYNLDGAGVNYFRTLTPAMEIERNHSDEFYVEINPQINFNDPAFVDYLKTFHIIHYHRQFLGDSKQMLNLANELKKSGTILMVDIDDYWNLHQKHPFYTMSLEKKLYIPILENLKIADYVTTTTDLFADEIRKVTGKDNVGVFYNSVDPVWMKQFQNNWKPDPDGRVRIIYMAGSCYDDKTEVLTNEGWKLFESLNKNETIATLNPITKELEYQSPADYISQPYNGNMFYGENKNVDFAVTPNHNMYISTVKSGNRKKPFNFKLIKMEELNDYDLTFKKDANWVGKQSEFFDINYTEDDEITNESSFWHKTFNTNDWLTFFGYWLGDGWTTSDGYQIGVCGTKENSLNKLKEIELIMKKYGYNPTWTKNGKSLRIFNKDLWKYLNVFGGANEKYIPKLIKNLSKEHLSVLFENYLVADGTIRKNGRISCDTVSKQLADDLTEIALKLGISSTVKNRGVKNSVIKEFKKDELILRTIIGRYDVYNINFYRPTTSKKSQLTPTVLNKKIKVENYTGNIYCVTVPNHIIYVRRNGKSYWCGNSHMADVEQLQGVMNVLSNDSNLKDKFKVIIAGWDTEGNTTDITFNQEFGTELQKRGLWVHKMVKDINKSRGDVDKISNLPIDLKEKYRGKIFNTQQRDIKSTESVYYIYEKILTNNHRMISNPDYIQWLFNFERNVEYPEEGNFARRWTQKANTYAKVLDETDIVIAPLADNSFNKMKCVTENTLISTDYGIFKIGDIVNNSHWQIMKIFNENIINVFKYPNENVVKLITENGYEIEGTETHKILIDNKWMMLGNVNVGDDIEITRFEFESKEYQRIHYPLLLSKRVTDNVINKACKGMIPSIEINEFYGRFFGYMLGDGHFSKGYLNITCDKRYEDVVDDIKTLVEYMGLVPIIYDKKPDKRCKNSLAKEGFGLEIRIPSKHLAEICCRENLRNEKGKVFEVPHFILKSPKSVIREFLRGLFEADGMVSVEGSYVSFTTKSENFAKQIQYLLLGFNIVSKITYSYNKIYNRYYYNIRLNRAASDLFYQEIGFISKIKSSKLKLVSEKKHSNRYSDQVWTSKVVEVKRDVKDVYDVEVEKIHIYNGNGIINHNSNLKQVECWSRKLPIVCSDIPPYNVHGRHMENCVLIPAVKNAHKYWTKYLKKLIINPDLRKQLGEQLYEDFKDQYNLANVTKKRADFYRAAVAKTLAVV